jgi:hypothetical protein
MEVSVKDIHEVIQRLGGFHGVYVPEFTFNQKRIDAAIIDVSKRWIRGFEIKVSRADFLADEKWQSYAEFCSSLSMVCPAGLIAPSEIPKPFGLLYISREPVHQYTEKTRLVLKWEKKPKRFQRRDGLAWLYQYVRVIEKELPRLNIELRRYRER